MNPSFNWPPVTQVILIQMKAGYLVRPAAIQQCIDKSSERVMELRRQREGAGGDDPAINRALRKEQTKVGVTHEEGTIRVR